MLAGWPVFSGRGELNPLSNFGYPAWTGLTGRPGKAWVMSRKGQQCWMSWLLSLLHLETVFWRNFWVMPLFTKRYPVIINVIDNSFMWPSVIWADAATSWGVGTMQVDDFFLIFSYICNFSCLEDNWFQSLWMNVMQKGIKQCKN